jgi:hypothetical protein
MDTDQPIYQRTMEELPDCIKHGQLYVIIGIHGDRIRCRRVRHSEKRGLTATAEQRTFYRNKGSKLRPAELDFIFVDSGWKGNKPSCSLFHIDNGRPTLYGL